jgi:hypothetical protein
MRAGESSRVVGPSPWAVHGEQQSRRSYEQDPSLSLVVLSELGQAIRRFIAVRWDEGANCLDCTRRDNR